MNRLATAHAVEKRVDACRELPQAVRADGGQASTGSSARYRSTSRAKPLAVS